MAAALPAAPGASCCMRFCRAEIACWRAVARHACCWKGDEKDCGGCMGGLAPLGVGTLGGGAGGVADDAEAAEDRRERELPMSRR